MEQRSYRVAGILFTITLDDPWRFMAYTAPVEERIRRAAAGETLPVVPTRAGDDVPARTFVQCKADLPAGRTPYDLDFSQYEPFRATDDGPAAFHLRVCAEEPEWVARDKESGQTRLLMKVDEQPPCYYIYDNDGRTIFEFDADRGHIAGTLCVSRDTTSGEYYPKAGFGPYTTQFEINTALMMLYTYAGSRRGRLLMHASVVRLEGKAQLFLGRSGTGKSTHSHLWLEHIPGCDLVNDDNPVLSLENAEDGTGKEIYVYGTPWSGKTPCYRNLRVPVRAIVRLEQAPENRIKSLPDIQAYASVIASASSIRWDRPLMDTISATVEGIVLGIPCYQLDCLPNAEAARICCEGVIAKML